ncbi:hypothetical protein ABZY45_09065 [Streptomyces sp. NPDC006516]|uniref:hypothetical protein n=1 Tax=Streptomyces sp. NPDC006516 TaxID=3154309 RepID=UPI0033B487EB
MSIARRTLLTTTAAGTLLCALWFVPSAKATDGRAPQSSSTGTAAGTTDQARQASATREFTSGERLADTGAGFDTTPYLVGGTVSLCVGAGFVAFSMRRGTVPGTGF